STAMKVLNRFLTRFRRRIASFPFVRTIKKVSDTDEALGHVDEQKRNDKCQHRDRRKDRFKTIVQVAQHLHVDHLVSGCRQKQRDVNVVEGVDKGEDNAGEDAALYQWQRNLLEDD